MNQLPRILQVIFIITFCTLITLPILMGSWSIESILLSDKRKSESFPQLGLIIEDPREYFAYAERYFNDRYGLRQTFIQWHNRLKYFVLSVSSSEDVVLGKDGWLYWAMKIDGDPIAYYRGLKTLSLNELSELTDNLQYRSDWLMSRGVTYIFLVAPNKETIYPEFLPNYVTRLSEKSHLDRFINYFREHSTVSVVDPRPRLLEAKQHLLTYHLTDTHWNAYGAYVAYLQVVAVLGRHRPEVTPLMLSVKDFRRVPGAWPYVVPSKKPQPIDDLQFKDAASGDLAGMLGLQKILQDVSVVPKKFVARCARIVSTPYRPEGWENVDDGAHQSHGHKGLLTTKCEAKPLSVLVIHQSFGPLLIPYLSETFNRVTYAWTDSFKFVKDFVENEQVDVVIQVQVERHLLPDYMHIY